MTHHSPPSWYWFSISFCSFFLSTVLSVLLFLTLASSFQSLLRPCYFRFHSSCSLSFFHFLVSVLFRDKVACCSHRNCPCRSQVVSRWGESLSAVSSLTLSHPEFYSIGISAPVVSPRFSCRCLHFRWIGESGKWFGHWVKRTDKVWRHSDFIRQSETITLSVASSRSYRSAVFWPVKWVTLQIRKSMLWYVSTWPFTDSSMMPCRPHPYFFLLCCFSTVRLLFFLLQMFFSLIFDISKNDTCFILVFSFQDSPFWFWNRKWFSMFSTTSSFS